MKRIIHTLPDGKLSVVAPIINLGENITSEQALQRALAAIPASVNVQVIEALPEDRAYRNAWKAGNGMVEIDMAKARDKHREWFRRIRAVKFDKLDAEYMLADERGNAQEKQQIAIKKQELRDVTALPAIEAATTITELKAVFPECLR